jgi:HAMP domain-containing protein
MNDKEDLNHYVEFNPLTKILVAMLGTVLTGLAASTWNTVQSSNLEIVRLQTSVQSVRGDVEKGQALTLTKIESLERRVERLEGGK